MIGRDCDIWDEVANTLGVVAGLAIGWAGVRFLKARKLVEGRPRTNFQRSSTRRSACSTEFQKFVDARQCDRPRGRRDRRRILHRHRQFAGQGRPDAADRPRFWAASTSRDFFVTLKGDHGIHSLKAAQAAGAVTLNYGLFINTIINFVIVAFVLFLVIRAINRLQACQGCAAAGVGRNSASARNPRLAEGARIMKSRFCRGDSGALS